MNATGKTNLYVRERKKDGRSWMSTFTTISERLESGDFDTVFMDVKFVKEARKLKLTPGNYTMTIKDGFLGVNASKLILVVMDCEVSERSVTEDRTY